MGFVEYLRCPAQGWSARALPCLLLRSRSGRRRGQWPAACGAPLLLALTTWSTASWALPARYEEGGPAWDEVNVEAAFEPANRVGIDPASNRPPATLAQTSLAVRRSGLGGHLLDEQATQAGSGNFQLAIPILRLPGRGLDLALDLTYNSRVWTKQQNGTMVFDAQAGWPAAGWSLGFGKLVTLGDNAEETVLIEPDGTPHAYKKYDSVSSSEDIRPRFFHRTTDGSFIDYSHQFDGIAKYPNGLTVEFSAHHLGTLYPSRITDRNGNMIGISYTNILGPEIDRITDTLGRIVNFHYDAGNRLTAITGPGLDGQRRTLVRLHYRDLTLNPAFSSPVEPLRASTITVPDAIFFPGSDTGYWFGDSDSYSVYGMLRKVSERRGMSLVAASLTDQGVVTSGQSSREWVYDYPLGPEPTLTDAPTYTKMTETWEGMDTDTSPAVTSFRVETNADPRRVEVTRPDNTRFVQLSSNAPGSFLDGLPYLQQVYGAAGTLLQQKKMLWQQGTYDSPQLAHIEVFDEKVTNDGHRQWTATGFTYGPEYNRIEEVREYDFGGEFVLSGDRIAYDATVLRRMRMEYNTDLHYSRDRHIFYLPKVVEVYEGETALRSRTEFNYDGQALMNAPGVKMHRPGWNPYGPIETMPWHEFRGNVTEVKTYSDAANRDGAISETRRYDITGNLRTVSGSSCCEEESFDYTPETQYAYPTARTSGAADPASPARITTTARYDLNTGLLLEATDANGRKAEYSYDPVTLRLRTFAWPTSSRQPSSPLTTYEYNDAALTTVETTESGPPQERAILAQSVTRRNGVGLVVREESLMDGGPRAHHRLSSRWQLSVVESQYDVLGRLWKRTLPFRKEANPANEVKHWVEQAYDALGRVTMVRAPDGSEERRIYDWGGIGRGLLTRPASGQTVLVRDAVGRERWIRLDALGRLAVLGDPDSGIVAYHFDALDNVVEVDRLVFGWVELTLSCAVGLSALCEHGPVVGVHPSDPSGGASGSGLSDPTRPPGAEDPENPPGLGGSDVEDLPSISDGVWGLKATMLYGNFAYDSLGRLTRQRLAGKDNTLNIAGDLWSDAFTYDSRSNITSHTDARGVKTIYDYGGDPLNRLQAVTYDTSGVSDAAEPVIHAPNVRYEYMLTGDVTRLRRVTVDGVATEEYGYDAEGRLDSRTITLADRPAHPLVTEYTYDTLDRVTDIRHPAAYGTPDAPRRLVHHDYGVGGLLKGLTVDGAARISEIARDAAGRVRAMTVGASGPQPVTEDYGYDPETGLLVSQQVQRAGRSLLDLSYLYGERGSINGQLKGIIDNLDGSRSREFRYDGDGRLQSVTGGDQLWSQKYTYDWFGGRTGVTAAGTTADGTSIPRDGLSEVMIGDETQRILDPYGFAYDAAGNLTRGLGPDGNWQRYQYDAAGRLAKVLDDAGTTLEAYTYGVDRRRLATQRGDTPDERAYYAWGGNAVVAEYEETAASTPELRWTKSYIHLGGRLLATLAPGAAGEVVRYHHVDRTGTRRLVTEPANGTVAEQATLPYGTFLPAESTEATNPLFTSYDRSAVTGLDYAVNRHYDPQQGRFLQPDPLGIAAADLGDPQSLNPYAYVQNDPINATDRLGLVSAKCLAAMEAAGPFESVICGQSWGGSGGGDPYIAGSLDPRLPGGGGATMGRAGDGDKQPKQEALCHAAEPTYAHAWELGPASPLVTAEKAMQWFKQIPGVVFPFGVHPLSGERSIVLGAEYNLRNALPLNVSGNDPVRVISSTPTSFTFLTLPGHFRGAGETVAFRVYEERGLLYLEQSGTSTASLLDPLYDVGAYASWAQQAANLRAVLYGGTVASFPQICH